MFTREQSEVIESVPGDRVVFAAPGSGKTTVLANHVMHQISRHRVRARNIMAITFTKQAATDMRRRLRSVAGDFSDANDANIEAIRLGTFHAQIFRFMLQLKPNIPVILSPVEQLNFMRDVLTPHGLGTIQHARRVLNAAAVAKSTWPVRVVPKKLQRWIARYEDIKRRLNRWDFDDILVEFCRELERPNINQRLEFPVSYLLVDEFQDTNAIQWAILERLTECYTLPLFVVGDDDQSIYGFRGATPDWLVNFPKRRQGASVHLLSTNFRSDKLLVDHAQTLIINNAARMNKNIHCASPHTGYCKAFLCEDEDSELRFVLTVVRYVHQIQPQWTIAVLARARRQLERLARPLAIGLIDGVQLRTFHDAKGKEWDAVILVGLIESNPYLAIDAEPVNDEEDRRLFYVALTRARHAAYLSIPKYVGGKRTRTVSYVQEARIPVFKFEPASHGRLIAFQG